MTEEDEETLARRALGAVELLEPGKLEERVKGSVADAASTAALRGLAAIGRLTGKSPPRSPARARAAAEVDVGRALDAMTQDDLAEFEARVRQAAARTTSADAARRLDLAELRRSFPAPAAELALLIFNCVDLLEELSGDAEGRPPSAEELARKEALLIRIADLLAPRSEAALRAFVAHVVSTSRRYRSD